MSVCGATGQGGNRRHRHRHWHWRRGVGFWTETETEIEIEIWIWIGTWWFGEELRLWECGFCSGPRCCCCRRGRGKKNGSEEGCGCGLGCRCPVPAACAVSQKNSSAARSLHNPANQTNRQTDKQLFNDRHNQRITESELTKHQAHVTEQLTVTLPWEYISKLSWWDRLEAERGLPRPLFLSLSRGSATKMCSSIGHNVST